MWHESSLPATALTVRQPWASLIVAGIKDVENRTWSTKFRGTLTVHAAKAIDRTWAGSPAADVIRAFLLDQTEPLPLGAIVGAVTVVDVVPDSPSPWAEPDCLHWLLADAVRLDQPIPAAGRLGLWRVYPLEPAPTLC